MTVTSFAAAPGSTEEVHQSLDKLLNSDRFRKTPSLRHLLEYLVTRALAGHTDQIKESIIAIDVFGRREDFDSRLDNIVRVQAHRLRKVLDAYYSEEGKDERIRFSVPKGSYIPQVERMDAPVLATVVHRETAGSDIVHPDTEELAPSAPVFSPRTQPASRPGLFAAFAAGIALSALLVSAWITLRPGRDEPVAAVKQIWSSVLVSGATTIATYTNPSFLRIGNSQLFLNYNGAISAPMGAEVSLADNDPAADLKFVPKGLPMFFADGWTGTGEVLAVNRLTLLSTQFRAALSVVPSRVLSAHEMRSANVIFLGAPWGNGALASAATNSTPLYPTNDGLIVVRKPGGTEPKHFENIRDERTHQLKTAYALFSVLPGMDGAHKVVSSAGLGTIATWAGIDFTTSTPGAEQMEKALKSANSGAFPRFYQAVIQVDVVKGNASNLKLMMVRVVNPADGSY